MLRSPILLLLALTATIAGLMPGGFALGSVERPGGGAADAARPAAAAPADYAAPARKSRRISSYYGQLQSSVFAKLRPVGRDEPIDFDEATALLNDKTLSEKIFNKDFEKKMRDQYAGKVSPYEKTATDPTWRPSYYDVQRYENGRHDLAQWTTREVMEDELKDFFSHADRDSTAMKALSTARTLTGGEDEQPAPKKPTPEEQAKAAHRAELAGAPAPAQEEAIPTKLKTKVNVLKQNGSIVFSNPVAVTSVNGSRDDVTADMTREFHQIALRSKVAFGMKDECLNVNVNKKVTDHVSLDLDHYSYTGSSRDANGYKVKEQAKVNYSLSF